MFIGYGEIKGFRLFKYMDTHCILALVLVSIVVTVFPEHYVSILLFYATLNIAALVLVRLWKLN